MRSFYDLLNELVETEKIREEAPEYYNISQAMTEPFRDYGCFLDELPSEEKQIVAITVYGLLLRFSLEDQIYTSQALDENSELIKAYLSERKKRI